jgi:hypothetical protein
MGSEDVALVDIRSNYYIREVTAKNQLLAWKKRAILKGFSIEN